jgi:hypothetical protein
MQHMPRRINIVADGLNCWWEGQGPQEGNGDSGTVNPDRDKVVGLVNNILLTHNLGSNEHLFVEVIDAITAQDSTRTV